MLNRNILAIFIAFTLIIGFFSGCDQEVYGDDEIGGPGKLEEGQQLLEDIKMMLKELAYMAPRAVHDYNLKTIDNQIDLFIMVEGKEPSGIGEAGQSGTLVGDGYLKKDPPIPIGLRQDTGEWSAYRIGGDPPRTWPVGDWEGAYRSSDD